MSRGWLSSAMPGLRQGVMGLAGGARAEQAGYEAAQAQQTKMALALEQMREAAAKADRTTAENDMLAQRPGLWLEQIAASTGADVPTVEAVRQRIRTGRLPQVQLAGPTEDGEPLTADMQIAPEVQSRVARALANLTPMMANTGDIAPGSWAEALSKLRTNDLRDEVLAGALPAARLGEAQAASEGKPLVNPAEWGIVNNFTGVVDAANPVAQRFGTYRGATTAAQQANARQSDAAAAASRAQADRTRAEAADGVNRGGARAPAGYRWRADGTSLEFIPGGPADPTTQGAKLTRPPTEGQARALMFAARMQLSDEVLSDLEGQGVKTPGAIAQAAQGTVGLVPVIGDKLAEAADSTLNWTRSDAQQKVNQARRDFINAILRKESGAVISPQEFANAERQYFPQVGDSPAVIRQKQANRRAAIEGMKAEFGEGFLPQFQRVLAEGRRANQSPAAARQGAGASDSWDDGSGWKVEKVR